MSKTITMRVDDPLYETMKRSAQTDRRTLANWIETTVVRHMEECQFASDLEMLQIRRDGRLVARLRQGSRDARARRGRLVG